MGYSRGKCMRKSGWRLLAFLALFMALAACAVNPVTHQSQLSLMSEQQEIATGQKLYPLYTQMSYGLFQDGELQAYVQEIGQRLASVSHRPHMAYEFNVVNSSELNAYALPGGKISITRGLVAKMENEASWLPSWAMRSLTWRPSIPPAPTPGRCWEASSHPWGPWCSRRRRCPAGTSSPRQASWPPT